METTHESNGIVLPEPERVCRNCKHWRVLKNDPHHGVCKGGYPTSMAAQVPASVIGGQPGVVFIGHWPTVSAEEDCDRFEERESA